MYIYIYIYIYIKHITYDTYITHITHICIYINQRMHEMMKQCVLLTMASC